MSEREADDTPKPGGPPPRGGDARPGSYYYDDATGYEVYDPAGGEEDDGDADESEE